MSDDPKTEEKKAPNDALLASKVKLLMDLDPESVVRAKVEGRPAKFIAAPSRSWRQSDGMFNAPMDLYVLFDEGDAAVLPTCRVTAFKLSSESAGVVCEQTAVTFTPANPLPKPEK